MPIVISNLDLSAVQREGRGSLIGERNGERMSWRRGVAR